MEKIRLYHIDSSEEGHQIVKSFLKNNSNIRILESTDSPMKAIEEINKVFPDIILLDENVAYNDLPTFIESLLLISPYIGIIVTSSDYSRSKFRAYSNAGARDFLVKPYTSKELVSSIGIVNEHVRKLKEHIVKYSTKILTKVPKVITVFSAKGGVGKSTISSLLACGLSMIGKEDSIIVDLDLQFGDISLMLDVKLKATITNIAENIDKYEPADLRPLLSKHYTGAYILPSPISPEEEEFITDAALKRLFALLRKEFDYTIIDTPPGFSEQTIIALEESDLILFITSPEIVSLKNTKAGLETLRQLRIDQEKIKVIINRFTTSKNSLSVKFIEEVLSFPIYKTITDDYSNVIQFLNQGQPQYIYNSNSKTGKDLKDLINKLRTFHIIEQPKSKNKWFWGFRIFR